MNLRNTSFKIERSHVRLRGSSSLAGVVRALLLVAALAAGLEACSYSAVSTRHTMCIFTDRSCPGKMLIRSSGLSCKEKEKILSKHNELRQETALGRVMGQPPALNMKTMVWDDELATVAQRWADQCMPGHDRSRNVARFVSGQNVAAVWTYERDEGDVPDFETQVEAWFMEVEQYGFRKGHVEPFKFAKRTGHYTQLVWADTHLVGCGYTYYNDGGVNGYTKLYVCNYGPGGNVVGGSMYKEGFPGQPYCVGNGLRPSMDYKGLCEEDDVSYKSICSMDGTSMFHKPKPSSFMMMLKDNHVDFGHSHSTEAMSPMDVMHPDPPHMEMHHHTHHHQMMSSPRLHNQRNHMMLPPAPRPPFNPHMMHGMKTMRSPFLGIMNALNPWGMMDRFKLK